jgi:hypothetical protein
VSISPVLPASQAGALRRNDPVGPPWPLAQDVRAKRWRRPKATPLEDRPQQYRSKHPADWPPAALARRLSPIPAEAIAWSRQADERGRRKALRVPSDILRAEAQLQTGTMNGKS